MSRSTKQVHARLMTALAATGQHATAVQIYWQLMRLLAHHELGIRPGPQLAAVHRRILREALAQACRLRAQAEEAHADRAVVDHSMVAR